MSVIYLLRHGETKWNRAGRIQGHRDSPLTDRGRTQAWATGERLRRLIADWPDFRLIASSLGRCRETAGLVAGALGYDVGQIELEPRLREHGYGRWEGLTWDEAAAQDPDVTRARAVDRWGVNVPDGESYALVAARVSAWLADLPAGSRLVVVGHGCAGRILRGVYAGLARADIQGLPEAHTDIHRLSDGEIATFSEA